MSDHELKLTTDELTALDEVLSVMRDLHGDMLAEIDGSDAAIDKVFGAILDAGEKPGNEGPGCPSCGSPDHLFVTAGAIGFVELTLRSDHIDDLEWGAMTDIDIGDAKNLQCHKCDLFQEVGGDDDLPELLGLKTGDDE